jgi:DNA-binding transcriptional MerR regulator
LKNDELGLLAPMRVDELSGYGYYESAQLEHASCNSALRQLEVPVATIKDLLELDPERIAERITALWCATAERHAARRRLSSLRLDQLMERKTIMYEVATMDMPWRSPLCLKRNVEPFTRRNVPMEASRPKGALCRAADRTRHCPVTAVRRKGALRWICQRDGLPPCMTPAVVLAVVARVVATEGMQMRRVAG